MLGKLIAIEGVDGAGTTTQAALLAQWLIDHGVDCVITAEPTDGPLGQLIRQALSGRFIVDPETLALMFAADRLDHLARTVRPALEDGLSVVTDRYVHSSLAYQSLGANPDWVATINSQAPPADLVILLDAPVDLCLERVKARDGWLIDIFENESFLERVRANYLRLARLARGAGERVKVLDAARPVEEVTKAIINTVKISFSGRI